MLMDSFGYFVKLMLFIKIEQKSNKMEQNNLLIILLSFFLPMITL